MNCEDKGMCNVLPGYGVISFSATKINALVIIVAMNRQTCQLIL
jgi:hypothetical protein